MWCLKGREGLCVYILPNEKKSFGKTLSDIKLVGDATISRLHAIVSVESIEGSDIQYRCVINDVSKYGTYVIRNETKQKLPPEKFALQAGDIIQFGLKESTFTVSCHTFVIAKSSLNEENTKKLKDIVHDLKATLFETWESSCTHLTMAENILFTTKLACALASAKPIITNAYWEAVNTAIKESKELPDIEDYLPKVKEEWLAISSKMLLPNENRRTLFKGLSFVHFCAKQYFTYAPLITAAGGKSCVYPTKRPLTPRDLTAKNAIVIQQPVNDSTQFTQVIATDYPIIYHKLQAVKRRMISETEIPLAILHCSTETYCNPKKNFATFLRLETQQCLSSSTIIENTQDIVNTNTKQIKRKIIPETCESLNENVSKKICCFDKNEENISDIDKSDTITTLQNTNDKKSKYNVIPETCDSNKDSKSSNLYYEDESISTSGVNENNIINNMQDIDNEKKKHEMTDKVSDSLNNENILIQVPNISEQKYINKSNIFAEAQDKNTNFLNKQNANKRFQIIPDSCNSVEQNLSNIFSNKSNNEIQIVSETCTINKELENSFAVEEEQQNIKLYEKINDKNYLDKQRNTLIEKDNDKFTTAKEEKSKNLKIPHPLQEINNSQIDLRHGKEYNFNQCVKNKLQDISKKLKVSSDFVSKNNPQNKRMEEDKRKNEKEEFQKTVNKQKYLNEGFTDKILRKDEPCGKRFVKVFVMKPKSILKLNNFVS